MTLIEALTTKRPKDGRVADWAVDSSGTLMVRFNEEGWLMFYIARKKAWEIGRAVNRDLLTSTDFEPHWEAPAPMVPKPGEVWGYTAADGVKEIVAWAHCYPDRDGKLMGLTWALDGVVWVVTKSMIHGQNGWRLVYSPDPERMRRAQG